MRQIKKFIPFLFLVVTINFSVAQHVGPPPDEQEPKGLVKWLSFKEAFELNKKQQKPFIIDIYTEWCGWCKHMIKTTYSNPGLASYINTNFYPVQFDAETKDTIEYLGTKYFNESAKPKSTHQLAVKLLGRQLSYPSTIFLCNNLQYTLNTAGYLDAEAIEPLLIFCVENIWRTTAYDDFKIAFTKAFKQTKVPATNPSFTEVQAKNTKKAKKQLVFISTPWCNGCKVMNQAVINDSVFKKQTSTKFYLSEINAEINDTIIFKGNSYMKTGKYGQFHDWVIDQLGGNLTLPSLIVYDEKQERLDVLPFYMSAVNLKPIMEFYGDNIYLKKKWPEFLEEYKKREEKKTVTDSGSKK